MDEWDNANSTITCDDILDQLHLLCEMNGWLTQLGVGCWKLLLTEFLVNDLAYFTQRSDICGQMNSERFKPLGDRNP
jgi:hypothetical protein